MPSIDWGPDIVKNLVVSLTWLGVRQYTSRVEGKSVALLLGSRYALYLYPLCDQKSL
jgi:hypothetical protein